MIKIESLSKIYKMGDTILKALDDVTFEIKEGEMVAITGTSGSGKSTLMNIIGCLDRADKGSYFLSGNDILTRTNDELAEIRNRMIGFIFQNFNLLPRINAFENVELPLLYAGKENKKACKFALESVGLGDRMEHFPNQLSGGQKQRVAIARAIVTDPAILLADEPTGAIDSKTTEEVMDIFENLNAQGRTIIIVTHERDIANRCKRQIQMKDGKIIKDEMIVKV